MSVSLDDVRKVAQLARLALTPEEEQRLVEELNQVLTYAASLEELDTTGIAPTAHVLPMANVFRKDTPGSSLPQAEALANAPSSGHGHFRVPKVIE